MNKPQPTPPAHCTFEPEDWLRLATVSYTHLDVYKRQISAPRR